MTKVCTKCKLEQPIEEFGLRKDRAPGTRNSHCRACGRAISKSWKLRNPERTKELSRRSAAAFFKKFPERVRENACRSVKNRLKTSIDFRILHNLRRRLNKATKGTDRSKRTQELLGCSIPHFKAWMEFWMQPGMTWENYGEWHVDHKMPCASFDMKDPEQQQKCFHYTNLQPLWAKENLQKSSKIL